MLEKKFDIVICGAGMIGMIFSLLFIYFLPNENFLIKITISFFFLIGFLSDINYLTSPIKRIFFQVIILIIILSLTKNLFGFLFLILCYKISILNIFLQYFVYLY